MDKEARYAWLDRYLASKQGQKATGELIDAPSPADLLAAPLGHAAVDAVKLAGGLSRTALQKAVGRVATNTIVPIDYGWKAKLDYLKEFTPKQVARAIIDDRALWASKENPGAFTQYELKAQLRDTPYRMQFGLEPRYSKAKFAKNPDGSIRFSEAYDRTKIQNSANLIDWDPEDGSIARVYNYHDVMGDFKWTPDKRVFANDSYDMGGRYYDKWDFALNPGEKLNTPNNFLRYAMDKLTNTVEIKGTVPNRRWDMTDARRFGHPY